MKRFVFGKKRWIAAIVILAAMVLIPAAWAEESDFTIDSYGTITDYTGSALRLQIPSEINGIKVTRIGRAAFRFCDTLYSVAIPEGVEQIDDSAFNGCTDLASVTLPGTLEQIGDLAFVNCESLKSVTVPEGVWRIGKEAFRGCIKLESVVLPESLTRTGDSVFQDCDRLTSINIPASLTTIADAFLYECTSLESLIIPEGVETIGEYAFYNCYNLKSLTFPESVTSIGDQAFKYYAYSSVDHSTFYCKLGSYAASYISEKGWSFADPRYPDFLLGHHKVLSSEFTVCIKEYLGDDTSVEIPTQIGSVPVTVIGKAAFKDCESLVSVTIPEGVTTIDNGAFEHCRALKEISIPSSVWYVNESAFYGCSALESVTFVDPFILQIEKLAFSSCYALKGVYVQTLEDWLDIFFRGDDANPMEFAETLYIGGEAIRTEIAIPEGVTDIGSYAFSGMDNLTRIDLHSGITEIGEYAFCGCSSLAGISIPDGVTQIGEGAFYGCAGLAEITVPGGVSEISAYAFCGCSGLTHAFLSEGLVNIGEAAFKNCSGLTSMTLPESLTKVGENVFYGCKNLEKIVSLNLNGSFGGSDMLGNCPAKVYCYSSSKFRFWADSMGYSVRYIRIADIDSPLKLTLPADLETIGEEAFVGAVAKYVVIPDGCKTIESRAFANNAVLTHIYMPDGVETIATDAFDNCPYVTFYCESENAASVYADANGIPWKLD